jgi:cytochrome c oxidase subunit 2
MAEATRAERLGAGLLLVVSLGLLLAWPGWRASDVPPGESYAQDPVLFVAAAETYAERHQVAERDGVPVVAPMAGADVPVIARRFQFWPALRLRAGQTYHLHVMAVDTVHSVVIAGRELALLPGQARVVTVVADGDVALQCGEYCGLGHNRMRGHVETASP